MQSISVFPDGVKFVDFSRIREVCHVMHVFFGPSLSKV